MLRSCFYGRIPPAGRINCGECEKCLRTMLALVALGKLDRAPTFWTPDVPAMLEPSAIENPIGLHYYTECAEALIVRERHDLVASTPPKNRRLSSSRPPTRVLALTRRATGL